MVRRLIAAPACVLVFAVTVAAGPASMKTAKDVMLTLTIPGSDAVFEAAAEPPTKAADWVTLRRKAAPLIESADLLLTPTFAMNDAEWPTLAQAHQTAATAALNAIDKKDANALSNASDALYETCDNCHKRFMQK
jgi:hypothetical protein